MSWKPVKLAERLLTVVVDATRAASDHVSMYLLAGSPRRQGDCCSAVLLVRVQGELADHSQA